MLGIRECLLHEKSVNFYVYFEPRHKFFRINRQLAELETKTAHKKTQYRLAILSALLLAFAMRLYRLGAESFWYDETVSVHLAKKPVAQMLAHTAGDIHPPGYYLLLHGWQRLTTPSLAHGLEFLYAWPSLWFGVVLLALLFPIGLKLVGKKATLIGLWLGAVHPFHLWYSQEVRMYTLGTTLGLVALWAILHYFELQSIPQRDAAQKRNRQLYCLATFVLATTLALYTLYYFLFLFVALDLIIVGQIFNMRKNHPGRTIFQWLATHLAILLLWLPWLPTFWRQATDPPVPPWRERWQNLADLFSSLHEGLASLLIGQTASAFDFFGNLPLLWPWAWLTMLITIIFAYTSTATSQPPKFLTKPNYALGATHYVLLLYTFLPAILIYLITAVGPPIYHVRYLFLFAPPFLLITGSVIAWLSQWKMWSGTGLFLLLMATSSWGLFNFWTHPNYQADDHRGAVAHLAQQWRPGDVILVNAGWAYTILDTYWPSESTDRAKDEQSTPPSLHQISRFHDYAQSLSESAQDSTPSLLAQPPILLRTGTVNGDPNLGWGNPASDFFAIDQPTTATALAQIAQQHPRLWHYRLYDTVSDPQSTIREWLNTETTLHHEYPIPGRDFGLLQLYSTDVSATGPGEQLDEVLFAPALYLHSHNAPQQHQAGSILYVELFWRTEPQHQEIGDLSMSLRLYRTGDDLVAQQDGAPDTPTSSWPQEAPVYQQLALPIPSEAGTFNLELVVYRQSNGEPLTLPEQARAIYGQRWVLNQVVIE